MNLWSAADVSLANELVTWFHEFLIAPNPMMRRSPASSGEAVCPFASACLENQTLYFAFHREINGRSTDAIERVVLEYREPFRRALPYQEKERIAKALLIVFPRSTRGPRTPSTSSTRASSASASRTG